MLGRTLGGATIAVFQGLIVFALSLVFGFRPIDLSHIPLAILFMALIALLFTALGTAVASVLEDMQGFQLIMNFLVMPLFFFSGALFPVSNLPPLFSFIVKIDPLSYGVDALRGALNGIFYLGLYTDFFVLLGCLTIALFVGSFLFSKIQI
jgi:ABC-2 type transport system permease protein